MSEEKEFSKLARIKECPICGRELAKGYVGAYEGIVWSSDKRKYPVPLTGSLAGLFSYFAINIPALKCKQCNLIIHDSGYDWRTPRSFLKKCFKCAKEIPIAGLECSYCGTKQPDHETLEEARRESKKS